MSRETPPIGGHAPPLRCSRLLRYPDPASQCPSEATYHVIWDLSTMENGLCCDEHADEAKRRFSFDKIHPYHVECSMPWAEYIEEINKCIVNEGLAFDSSALVRPEPVEVSL